jgi:flagellar biosynthesis GTPase FlhF
MTMNAETRNPEQSASPPPRTPGAKIYRGHSIAALLPQVRAELGPNAVVLRQREGRTGGIGGFFAQRFIEIEAMAPAPAIDLYDEPETDLYGALTAADEQAVPQTPSAPAVAAGGARPAPAMPSSPAAPPAAAGQERPAPITPSAQAEELRTDTPVWPDWSEIHPPEVEPTVERAAVAAVAAADHEHKASLEAQDAPSSFAEQLAAADTEAAIAIGMDPDAPTATEPAMSPDGGSSQPAAVGGELTDRLGAETARQLAAMEALLAQDAEIAREGELIQSPTPLPALEMLVAQANGGFDAALQSAAERAIALAGREEMVTEREMMVTEREVMASAREQRVSAAAGSAPAPGVAARASVAPAPSRTELEPQEREISDELLRAGVSDTLAQRLLAHAQAHLLPFAPEGGLRDAVRAELARSLPQFPGLPAQGAMVAVIGAGGAGKTRVAAAIAAAYKASSALSVRAAVLGERDTLSPLAALLAPHGVAVTAQEPLVEGAQVDPQRRGGELIVLDTPSVSPGDVAGIERLDAELTSCAPDAVLLALPATIAVGAARRMLEALSQLDPTALVITHADEIDQIGGAIEVAIRSGTPIAYIHDGLELPGALRLADPNALAEALLPS